MQLTDYRMHGQTNVMHARRRRSGTDCSAHRKIDFSNDTRAALLTEKDLTCGVERMLTDTACTRPGGRCTQVLEEAVSSCKHACHEPVYAA